MDILYGISFPACIQGGVEVMKAPHVNWEYHQLPGMWELCQDVTNSVSRLMAGAQHNKQTGDSTIIQREYDDCQLGSLAVNYSCFTGLADVKAICLDRA